MNIAVTGASGFLGRHVLAELRARDINVVATCRTIGDADRETSGLRWVGLDIAEPPGDVYERLGCPDALIHLAWGGLPNYKSLHHVEEELPKHYRFLAGLVRQGLPALVAAGTCFEYGMQSGPLDAHTATKPANPYGFAKDVLRQQLGLLSNEHPYSLTWARLFYMYGDGQPASSLFPLLRDAVDRGGSEFPMSGGEQLRDYLPVQEVAKQLVTYALDPKGHGLVNICSGTPISVRRLVEQWIVDNNWEIEPIFGVLPYPDHEPLAFWGVPESDAS